MKQMLPHIGFIFKRNIRDKKNFGHVSVVKVPSKSKIFIILL